MLKTLVTVARATARRARDAGRVWAAGLLVAAAVGVAMPASAQVAPSESAPTLTLHVPSGKSEPLAVSGAVERVVVAQPEIAKIDIAGPGSLYVMGRDIGTTNLLLYGPDAQLLEVVNVEVGYDAPQLQTDLKEVLPGEPIAVRPLTGALLLSGAVSSSEAKSTAEALAERAAPGSVVSIVDVRPTQVQLEMQLVEASEETLREIGVDLGARAPGGHVTLTSGTGLIGADAAQGVLQVRQTVDGTALSGRLQALERTGSARILAQPTLVALSGEEASFHSGGVFPFPVPDGENRIVVEFRPYGTAIAFRPTVQTNGLIRLRMASEVSGLDTRNSIKIDGATVPSLSTRRIVTTADLHDGETLVLAGLLQDTDQKQARQTPWLGDVPLLGALFRSGLAKQQRLELAVIVTARVARSSGDNPEAATEALAIERIPPPAGHDAARPKRAGVLSRLAEKSPAVRAVTTRVVSAVHATLDVSRRGVAALHGLSRRLFAGQPESRPAA